MWSVASSKNVECDMENEIIELRAHHLLCSVLFEGKGYSETFTENMTHIVNRILEKDKFLYLKKSRDIICVDCPNLKEDGGCMLDEKIPDLDGRVLTFFDLPVEEKISSVEVFEKISNMITPDFFAECCDECRWKKMGICNYEKYIKNINRFK